MKLNNNERLITPHKITATVSVIGEPNHHYNHVESFYNVRTTVHPDYYTLENDYDDNV
jgi:hypothetical protein